MLTRLTSHLLRLISTSLVVTVMITGTLFVAQRAGAAPNVATLLSPPFASAPPQMISYQGIVKANGSLYNGTGYLKFALVDAASGDGTGNYWSNDGTVAGEPTNAVALNVTDGRFTVLLGDTSVANMTEPLTDNHVSNGSAYLRVWFSAAPGGPYEALEPNQRLASVAYALRAASADQAQEANSLAASEITLHNTSSSYNISPGNYAERSISCPSGKRIVAGGVLGNHNPNPAFDPNIEYSYPSNSTTWTVRLMNRGSLASSGNLTLFAVCITAQ